jgi:hypothetical protein
VIEELGSTTDDVAQWYKILASIPPIKKKKLQITILESEWHSTPVIPALGGRAGGADV